MEARRNRGSFGEKEERERLFKKVIRRNDEREMKMRERKE